MTACNAQFTYWKYTNYQQYNYLIGHLFQAIWNEKVSKLKVQDYMYTFLQQVIMGYND